VLDSDTGLWHGYFAEMTHHCTLSAWTTNSITVHATSTQGPAGPFQFENTVQPAWSHNPLITKDPTTGDYLVAHIGCGTIAPGHSPQNCSSGAGSGGGHVKSKGKGDGVTRNWHNKLASTRLPPSVDVDRTIPPCECGKRPGPCQTLQILRSATPSGPFADTTVAWPLTNGSEWPSCLSNPTLLFPGSNRSDSSSRGGGGGGDSGAASPVLLAFNGNLAPPNNHGPTSYPGLLVSPSGNWKGL
jgi:hypothetical protein